MQNGRYINPKIVKFLSKTTNLLTTSSLEKNKFLILQIVDKGNIPSWQFHQILKIIKIEFNKLDNINQIHGNWNLFSPLQRIFLLIAFLSIFIYYGFNENMTSHLQNNQQTVMDKTHNSFLLVMNHGVPQGSVPRPILFSVYVTTVTELAVIIMPYYSRWYYKILSKRI